MRISLVRLALMFIAGRAVPPLGWNRAILALQTIETLVCDCRYIR